MSWDWIIGILIIIAFILTIWARASRQTVPELIGDLRDRLTNRKEDVEERLGIDIYE